MVNWKSLILLLILLFSSFTLVLPFANGTQADSNVIFSDDFDRTQVDASKWVVMENTNMSGYPAYGGNISVSDGHIALSSGGSSFPWVYTKNNPFPASGDFSVEFNLTFTCLGDWGSCIRIFADSPTDDADKWTGCVLSIGAGDEDPTRGKITIELFGKEVHRIYVPGGFKPSADPHIFRLDYHQGNYTVYVDNTAVGTVKTDIRVSAIGLGHPPCYYVPFSPQKVEEWGYWGWTSFSLDSIKVTATSNETPDENDNDSEPTTQHLNGNATFLVESNSTLSAIAFNSETNEASFTVTGPSGTTGYIRCIIPKTLLSDPNMLNLYLDGNKTAEYSITEFSEDSWLLYFTYSHSSHIIMLAMQTLPQTDFTVYGVIVAAAILGLLAAGVIVFARNLNK
jgi:hypothetical protein